MLYAIECTPAEARNGGIGRLAPVPDRLRYAPSNGAQHLEFLRAMAAELDAPSPWVKLAPDYDRQCYLARERLRSHAAYLIEVGVRG